MLTLAKNSLTGTVMGKPIFGSTIYRGADEAPTPGEYDLLPPVDDPIFGPCVIAVPREAGYKPGYDIRKLSIEPGTAPRHEGIKTSIADTTEAGLVLSKQPIPGRNCVVMVSGFSDLLDVLLGADEATLTVM